jgi:hypothetical protein
MLPQRDHNEGREIRIIKNDGNHPFPVDHVIELWGGCWLEDDGTVTTPDGDIPFDSYIVLDS